MKTLFFFFTNRPGVALTASDEQSDGFSASPAMTFQLTLNMFNCFADISRASASSEIQPDATPLLHNNASNLGQIILLLYKLACSAGLCAIAWRYVIDIALLLHYYIFVSILRLLFCC